MGTLDGLRLRSGRAPGPAAVTVFARDGWEDVYGFTLHRLGGELDPAAGRWLIHR